MIRARKCDRCLVDIKQLRFLFLFVDMYHCIDFHSYKCSIVYIVDILILSIQFAQYFLSSRVLNCHVHLIRQTLI